MGIFGIFKKQKSEKSALEKRLLTLKSKRINCCFEDFEEFLIETRADIGAIMKLKPVNYYAVKNEYIEAHWFYTENYDEVYVKFNAYKDDKIIGKSEIFKGDREILVRFFAKVGIIIKPLGDNLNEV